MALQHNYRQCVDSHIPGYQFDSHYDCVYNGYALAQRSLKFLSEDEDWSKDRINKKMVIKFECKELPKKNNSTTKKAQNNHIVAI